MSEVRDSIMRGLAEVEAYLEGEHVLGETDATGKRASEIRKVYPSGFSASGA